jgi:diguanylate cyclase (GGDEF)-like protein
MLLVAGGGMSTTDHAPPPRALIVASLRQFVSYARAPLKARDDDYAGADLRQAHRATALFSVVSALTIAVMLPLSPPTAAVGGAGWVMAIGVMVLFLGGAVWIRGERSFGSQLAAVYVGMLLVAALEWLAGGYDSPYHELYVLAVVAVAGVHPKRRVALFLLVLSVASASPLLYVGVSGEGLVTIGGQMVFLIGLTAAVMLLMHRVREQRLDFRRRVGAARELARVDQLTGLGNRRAFDEVLDREIARSLRVGSSLTVGVADLDGFKQINDSFGHVKGDECLRTAARALADEVRGPDVCFRWGGDEFALVLPDTDRAGAELLAGRLCAAVREACVVPDGMSISITTGFSELRGEAGAAELLALADRELMARKGASSPAPGGG